MKPVGERQLLHLLCLGVLLGLTWPLVRLDTVRVGSLWVETPTLFGAAVGVAVVHQVYVWAVWRLELHHDWVTSRWPDSGFRAFSVGFAVLGLGRLVFITWLALANRQTLRLPEPTGWILAGLCLGLSAYCFYSVHRYFGFDRAVGLDHFDPAVRHLPLVEEGVFRYTSNGMYTVGFLVLWVPGLLAGSAAAVLAAAFHHAYIWVHYYCTEGPDMREIYG